MAAPDRSSPLEAIRAALRGVAPLGAAPRPASEVALVAPGTVLGTAAGVPARPPGDGAATRVAPTAAPAALAAPDDEDETKKRPLRKRWLALMQAQAPPAPKRRRRRFGRPPLDDKVLLADVVRVANRVTGTYSCNAYRRLGEYCDNTLRNRFGSWRDILAKAGLGHRDLRPRRGGRHTWEECYANLDRLYAIYGRLPTCAEINRFPSRVGWNAYALRFGSWRIAKHHFLAARHGDETAWPMAGAPRGPKQGIADFARKARALAEARRCQELGPLRLPMALRLRAFEKDRYCCTRCGASPANDRRVVLHVDHIFPRARGGFTGLDNLRVLCRPCNLAFGTGDV
jgi:hypothetical protein